MIISFNHKGLKQFYETGNAVKLTPEHIDKIRRILTRLDNATSSAEMNVPAEMALKLSSGFKNTTPEFWLRVQESYDLAQARKRVDLKEIKVFWQPQLV
ncbi:MAG: addiction module antidote protein, HigA family [Sphingobacteriaceae bacterium]|nr:MAG: addiction module antidote protein, HigA family [Sphingobacteriaceae bacterium]